MGCRATNAPVTNSPTSTELLERARELAMLGECLDPVQRSSRGRVLLIGGEAGVGKTALLRRFRDDCPGARVLWGACDALFTPRPLGPFVDIAESTGGELEELVQTGARPYEVAAALVRELRERAPTVFVLEDVHWADEATLDVLRLLARRVETVPALIVASYRDDGLERTHPLRIVLGELATDDAVGRLKLAALSPAAVAGLAEPHAIDANELYRKTGGNPFFVVEALAAQAEDIPDTVKDAVFARVARLSPPAKRLLEAVAVVPPQAELWLLEALAGETIEGLDECLASGSSRPSRQGWRSGTSSPASPSRNRLRPTDASNFTASPRGARRSARRRARSRPPRPSCTGGAGTRGGVEVRAGGRRACGVRGSAS